MASKSLHPVFSFIPFSATILCMLCGAALNGQNKKLDSLRDIYNNKTRPDTVRALALSEIAWSYNGNNPDTAILLSEAGLNLSKTLSGKNAEVYASAFYNTIGVAYMNKGDYDKALDYYFKALRQKTDIGDKNSMAGCYGNIGFVYQKQSKFPQALENYFKALHMFEELKNQKAVGACYSYIGNVYELLSNHEKALECFFKSLKIREGLANKNEIAYCYNSIGGVYQIQLRYKEALEYYFKSQQIWEQAGNKKGLAATYGNTGMIYKELKDYTRAMEYYQKDLDISKQIANKPGVANCYNNLCVLYKHKENYKLALLYGDSCLVLSREIGDIDLERNVCNNLSDIFAARGQYKEAYLYHVKFKNLTDSIFNVENSRQIGDMKTKFEVEKKEAELKIKADAQQAINAEEKQKQQVIIYAVAGVLLVVTVFSVFLFNRFKVTQRQKKIIEEQKIEVDQAYEHLHEKNKEVIDSINYARRIQSAIITSEKYINRHLNRLNKEKY